MAEPSSLRVVVFRVGALVCAAPASIVREILPPLPATRIPGVAGAVDGLVNVRGLLLTVIDAHTLLGQPRPGAAESAAAEDGAIVMVELGGRPYGLAVSQVLDFLSVPAEAIAPHEELPGVDPRLVRAVGRQGDRHFILLDIEALLAPMLGG
ncbi:MAG TPA: chemotaxis protein CheW [Gemmatimonadales bacterium]|nr:chemotaxis protein CheW [Gemmatimonadales bacterium]